MTVDQQLATIKEHMPDTYLSIQAKAAEIGKPAYALVRRGLRGEPNCFYAFEKGHVVGTPFAVSDVMAQVALYMVTFGTTFAVVWPTTASELSSPPVGTPVAESRAGNSTPAAAPVAGVGKSPANSPRVGG